MPKDLTSVCVFCGCNSGASPSYQQAAADVGRLLARRGIQLVYGGAQAGLMGTVADATLAAGGNVVGVLPRAMISLEPPHDGLSELLLVGSMHERKALMAERSDAFIALPGGIGTMEETFETLSWTQLGLQSKPTGFLNVGGFFGPLMAQLDRMVEQAFVRAEYRRSIHFEERPARLLELLTGFEPPATHKWIDLDVP